MPACRPTSHPRVRAADPLSRRALSVATFPDSGEPSRQKQNSRRSPWHTRSPDTRLRGSPAGVRPVGRGAGGPGPGVGVARKEPRAHSAPAPPNPAPTPHPPCARHSFLPSPFPALFPRGCAPSSPPPPTRRSVCLPRSFHAAPSCPFSPLLHPRWHSQPQRSFHEGHPNPPTRDPTLLLHGPAHVPPFALPESPDPPSSQLRLLLASRLRCHQSPPSPWG